MNKEPSLPDLLQDLAQTETNQFSELVQIAGLNLQKDFEGIDLSGEDLSEDNLSQANLSFANLSDTNLRSTNLSGANLKGANLSGANLRNANLSHADLSGANLSDAHLVGVNLNDAILCQANLNGANLKSVNLTNTDLSGANLRNANLQDAKLKNTSHLVTDSVITIKEKAFEPFLEADKEITQAIADLFGQETILDDVCKEIQESLSFDFVSISLVIPEQNTIEAVYGIGIAGRWVDQARHYLNADKDIRDIQADIVDTRHTEIISGWDRRFDRWIYENFQHDQLNRIFSPIFLVHDEQGKGIENWFENYEWDQNFIPIPGDAKGNNRVIRMQPLPGGSPPIVIGTVEAGYENTNRPITYEQATHLAKLIARRALDIRRGSLRYVLKTIAENAKRIFHADLATLHFLWEPQEERYIYEVLAGDPGNIPLKRFSPRKNGVGWRSIFEGKLQSATYLSSVHKNSEVDFSPVALERGTKTYAAFPLLINDKYKVIPRIIATPTKQGSSVEREQHLIPVGVLYVHFRYEHQFIEELSRQGEYFASKAVDAIWHITIYQKMREEARQLATLQCVTQSLSQIENDLLSHIAWNTLNVLAADLVVIYEYIQTEKQFLSPPSLAGRLMQEDAIESEVPEQSVPFLLIQHETNIYVSNISQEPIFKNSLFTQREKIQSVAGILLRVDKDVVGVMFINYRRPHIFLNEEKQIISSIASSAASSIKNQRWLQTLDSIEREIITTLDWEQLQELIVQKAVQNTGADIGVISIVEPTTQELVAKARYPAHKQIENAPLNIKMGEGVTGWVAMHRKAALVNDVEIDERYICYFADSRSELCVPLLDKDCQTLGVLNVESRQKAKFKQKDLGRLEFLAGLAVIAIQNAQNAEKKEQKGIKEVLTSVGNVSGKVLKKMNSGISTVEGLLREIVNGLNENNVEANKNRGNTALSFVDQMSQTLRGLKIAQEEKPQPLDLHKIVDMALSEISQLHEVNLSINVPINLPKVLGGEQQLLSIFYHLIQNAIDAMPNGGTLSLNASTPELEDKLWVEVKVSDTGLGIAPDKFNEIFQLGFTTKSDRGNIGLGLWLTKLQVESLGGILKFDSSPNEGSQFTVTLRAYKQ